jgi:outer membrane receptor protein involved in Fe transport
MAIGRRATAGATKGARGLQGNAGRHSKVALAVAAAIYGATSLPVTARADEDTSAGATLQEIVITARKRTENLQDVPQSIDVFTSKDLDNLSISQFEDYATKTPSVSFISSGPGTQEYFMRGVSDGSNPNAANESSTGFFIDDMSMSYYGTIPDLHSYDIERIEVLNGPQGTLFGAGSMSGAIRIITKKPDPNGFAAGVDVDAGKIAHGTDNTTYEAFVNLPLIDGSTAVRFSVYSVHNGGFIDNLLTTRHWLNGVVSNNAAWARPDYNTQTVSGGRAAIKQVFSDGWSATLSANYQRQLHNGAWDQDPQRYGLDEVSRFGPENGNNYLRTLDLHVDGDVGIGDLVYAGTYWSTDQKMVDEYSNYVQYSNVSPFNAANIQSFACLTGPTIPNTYQGLPQDSYSGCQVPTMFYIYNNATQRWSNELRLQSKAGGRFHWLAGLYMEKTEEEYSLFYDMPNIQQNGEALQSQISYYNVYANEAASPLPHEWYSYVSRLEYLQYTEFTDLSFDLTPRWNIEFGVQHFQSKFNGSSEWASYAWQPKVPSAYDGGTHKVNFKAGTNFKVNKDLMLYAIFSQGYRDGGINAGLGDSCIANGAPTYYKPDTLNNFEVGWKSTLLSGRMTWNGAFYYMPWKDYQTPVYDLAICPATFNANIGDARVYGAESNVNYRVTEGLTLQGSLSYDDSKLTSDKFENPNFVVFAGERLPFVPYFAYSANARYERPVTPALRGYVQFDISHKGDTWSDLRAVDVHGFGRTLQPGYEISNLRLGVEAPGNRWTAELYVSNLFDTNAVIYSNTANYDHRQTTNEPRVIGLRASYRWGKATSGER